MNVYLQVLDDAKKLPQAFQAMGMPPRQFRTAGLYEDRNIGFDGWVVCQLLYKMNEEGGEWWSNQTDVVVSSDGQLFDVHTGEEGGGNRARASHLSIDPADAAKLRMWDENGWGFEKITSGIAKLL